MSRSIQVADVSKSKFVIGKKLIVCLKKIGPVKNAKYGLPLGCFKMAFLDSQILELIF